MAKHDAGHISCQAVPEEGQGKMRVSREKAAENHERIVETAARMFREHGFQGVGVDALMHGAGLTHGGFYGHFKSKEDLAAAAVTRALERSIERQSRYTSLEDLVSGYLSERHCADRANGCAVAALGADIVRQGKGVRRGLTTYVRAQLDLFTRLLRRGSAANRRKRAIVTLAGMVGALTLARAVDDPGLSKEILVATREIFQGKQLAGSEEPRTHPKGDFGEH
jgi:TetR/AcrR family transcriptional regulator, transcriptional repressor for nem operon